MIRSLWMAAVTLLVVAGSLLAQTAEAPQPRKLADLPANQWVRLPDGPLNAFQAPVYDPASQQLIGLLAKGNGTARLDRQTGTWQIDLEPTRAGNAGDQPLLKTWRLVDGRPNMSNVLLYSMITYDSQRKRIVAASAQLMGSYDPASRSWTDLEAKVPLAGQDYPGAPPAAWGSMCYDPVNDEIVQFGGGAIFNFDRWEKYREVTGTFETFIYDPKTNRWDRPVIGPKEFYAARDLLHPVRVALQEQMSVTGEAIVCTLNNEAKQSADLLAGQKDALAKVAGQIKALAEQVSTLGGHARLASGARKIAEAAGKLQFADGASAREIYAAEFAALQLLNDAEQNELYSHPHPRYCSQMVYLPQHKSILLFGGTDGRQLLNDTWLYDCTTRTWQRKSPKTLPRARYMHGLVYSDKLARPVLVGGYTSFWAYPKDELNEVWTYDVDADDWKLVLQQFPFQRGQSSYFAAYSPADDAIILLRGGAATFALKLTATEPLEVASAPAAPVLEDAQPFDPPADDPAVLERWKNLPANTWVRANPPKDGPQPSNEYGWGMMGCNSRLGAAILWGGGHSTHQANDIFLYFPGANRWVMGYPPHAINVPPWNKGCGNPGGVDWRGGVYNLHARRGLAGNGGKALINIQIFSPYWYGPEALFKQPASWGRVTTFEFDYFSRRWLMPLSETSTSGLCRPYDARNTTMSIWPDGAKWWDTSAKAWKSAADAKLPDSVNIGEGAGPVFIEKRNAGLIVHKPKDGPADTWLLDIAANQWQKLDCKGSPPGVVSGSAYIDSQDCVYATCFTGWNAKTADGQEAIYSFKRNAWTILPTQVDGGGNIGASHSAWTKVTYDPKHDLLIRFQDGSGTVFVMRPDFDKLDWK